MQHYMAQIDSQRPLYADIVKKAVDKKFKKAFNEPAEFVTKMKESRRKNSSVFTLGLWPLDVVSYNDWRESSHSGKSYPEYVAMARIERDIVAEYRPLLFKKCTAAAFIRMGLASALNEACKVKAWDLPNEQTGKTQKKTIRRFYYADRITCNGLSLSEAPKVNVVDLKQSREREAKSKKLAAEAVAILKKIENFKGSAAAPGSNRIDEGVSDAITRLHEVRSLF